MNALIFRKICLACCLVLMGCVANSCISLKSDYPKTSYYRLAQKPLASKPTPLATKESVLVKTFSIDNEIDTDHILALNGATEVQRYQYHRWIGDLRELATAYVANRLQSSEVFAGGVYTEATSLLPSIELEARLMDFTGRNGAAAGGTAGGTNAGSSAANTATVALHLTVKRFSTTTGTQTVLLQKVYSHSTPRPNDTAASIPEALSDALAAIVDEVLKDITALVQ
jgi:ABC-type uncharacterized transport system auxiliary subunit